MAQTILELITKGWQEGKKAVEDVGKASEDTKKKVKDLSKEADGASDKFKELGGSVKDGAGALAGFEDDAAGAVTEVANLAAEAAKAGGVIGALAGFVITATAALIANSIAVNDMIDEQDELATKMGLTNEKLQVMNLIANENGTSVQSLTGVYDTLSKALTKQDDDNLKVTNSFRRLGIDVKDLGDLSKEQIADVVVKNWELMGRTAQGTAAAQMILGGSFRDNIPAIKAAASEMGEAEARVKKYSHTVTNDMLEAAGKQEKAFSNLGLAAGAMRVALAENFRGTGTDAANWATKMIQEITRVNREMAAYNNNAAKLTEQENAEIRKQAYNKHWLSGPAYRAERNRLTAIKVQEKYVGGGRGVINPAYAEPPPPPPPKPLADLTNPKGGGEKKKPELEGSDIAKAMVRRQKQGNDDLRKLGEEEAKEERQRLEKLKDITSNGYANLMKVGEEAQNKMSFQLRTLGMSEIEKELTEKLDTLSERRTKDIELIKAQTSSAEEQQASIAKLNQGYEESKAKLEETARLREQYNGNWVNGFTTALTSYQEMASNIAQQSADAFGNAFKGMEDALVNFATTGKLSFSDLARSIIADLIRIQARAALSGLFGMIGNAIGGAIGGGGGRAISPMAGGGSYALTPPSSSGLGLRLQRANGGPVGPGSEYLVGEFGPEVIRMNGKGNVVPTNQLGQGSTVNNITVIVQGGNTNEETGSVVSKSIMEQMAKVADSRIQNARRAGGLSNPIGAI